MDLSMDLRSDLLSADLARRWGMPKETMTGSHWETLKEMHWETSMEPSLVDLVRPMASRWATS